MWRLLQLELLREREVPEMFPVLVPFNFGIPVVVPPTHCCWDDDDAAAAAAAAAATIFDVLGAFTGLLLVIVDWGEGG